MTQSRRLRPFLVLSSSRPWPCWDSRGPWRRPARARVQRRCPPAALAGGRASAAAGKVVYKVGWTRRAGQPQPVRRLRRAGVRDLVPHLRLARRLRPQDALADEGRGLHGPRHRLDGQRRTASPGRSPSARTRKWYDGVPLTAKDVAFTYNYIIQNEMENFTAYTNLIEKATAIDDYTVEFVCSKPKPDMIRQLGADPARARLVQGRPQAGGKRQVHQQPALRRLRPLQGGRVEEELARARSSRNPTWWGPKPKIDEHLLHGLHQQRHPAAGPHRRHHRRRRRPLGHPDEAAQDRRRTSRPAPSPSTASTISASTATTGRARATRCCKDWKFRQALNWAVDRDEDRRRSSGAAPPRRARRSSRPTTTPTPTGTGSRRPTSSTPTTRRSAKQKLDEAGYTDTRRRRGARVQGQAHRARA